jgi:hypothetical protein
MRLPSYYHCYCLSLNEEVKAEIIKKTVQYRVWIKNETLNFKSVEDSALPSKHLTHAPGVNA